MQTRECKDGPPGREVVWSVSWVRQTEHGVSAERHASRGQTAHEAWSRLPGAPAFGLCEFEITGEVASAAR